jgi:glycosyltransferase involved in cell wall biosynthesis
MPVYKDALRLRSCLQALEKQAYPRERHEVIAVDNGSSGPLQPVVARFPSRLLSAVAEWAYILPV